MKFATKLIRHYLPHLRRVATLPWEITLSEVQNRVTRLASHSQFSTAYEEYSLSE